MPTPSDLRHILEMIHQLNSETKDETSTNQEKWKEIGAQLLISIDKLITFPEVVNASIPREYSPDNACPLAGTFIILSHMISLNQPFNCSIWTNYNKIHEHGEFGKENDLTTSTDKISFYELALSRCCSLICQLLSDRVQYVQKLLLKYIFGQNDVCSLFASDIYMFVFRLIHPYQKLAMCQIIMNLCRQAPQESVVKGVALINRLKHPIINFENSKYMDIMDLT